jgi:predicted RNA binding protein YcfA (HicA-like mRNA interferase family)
MTKEGEMVTLSVPDHKEVARGTLRSLIRAANLTVDEFGAAI